ncbi:DUF6461 domain-containing protein [Micropruina sp.]|uniref:DUF6461 domain-containing protein n=1 Tax=Micropruina sp. TaxID=2737536 RepID=UPI0026092F49|nr:DUF6461 domain-containing protein [Micropruina sp.]
MALTDEDGWTASYEAACVSLASGCTPERLRDVLAGPGATEFPSADEAGNWVMDSDRYDRSWSAFGWYQGVAVAWEDNGFAGTDPDNAAKLSAGGRFASMFWNVNAVMQFSYLSDGQVLRQFDPLFHNEDEDPNQLGQELAAERELDWSAAPVRSGLALVADLFGITAITPTILAAPGVRFFGYRR